jgi:hypothetical protein
MMTQKLTSLDMNQGSTFGFSIIWNDVNGVPKDLTGYTARMQIRPSFASNTVTESLTTANGELVITANSGQITATLSATRTAAITVDYTTGTPPRTAYWYDLEAVSGSGVVDRLLQGKMTVWGEVTR